MNNILKSVAKVRLQSAGKASLNYRLSLAGGNVQRSVRCMSSTTESEKIVIPQRIERGPTDILNALSSTVGFDPTAAHFKYHDDPYLIPRSNVAKKDYALAQEAGRKAAHWIRQENAKLFQHKEADPPIEAYIPTTVYNEESKVELTDLQKLIENVEVNDARLVYDLLQKNKIEVSPELKQSLMELLCFYNHEEPLDDAYIEERAFQQNSGDRNRQRKTWNNFELAEQIFHSFTEKKPEHYCALIRGMSKYYQTEKAWALYQETVEKNVPLDTNTYNSLIPLSSFLGQTSEAKWDLICNFLTSMKNQKLKPNIGTLNAILQAITTIRGYNQARSYALKTMSEFKKLGIEPCLATWNYLLMIFCKERGPTSHILHDIMNEIENKEFTIVDPNDTSFFVTAMDVCRNHLQDKNLAKRVDALLHYKDNYNTIGDSYKETIYYRHYFHLLSQTETLETFMQTYNLLVPSVYIPEPSVMESILKSVDANCAAEFVPQIWSQMVQFELSGQEHLQQLLLQIMITNPPEDAELVQKFASIAWDMYGRMKDQVAISARYQQSALSGVLLGEVLTLLCRGQDFEKARELFEKINAEQNSIVGEPKLAALRAYIQMCIDERMPGLAIAGLQYCTENGLPESVQLGRHIFTSLKLDDAAVSKIKRLVGESALKQDPVSDEKSE